MDQEILQPFAGSKLRPKPPGLHPAAGPGLCWILRISILRKNRRIRAARPTEVRIRVGPLKLTQPLLKFGFFQLYLLGELEGHPVVETP
jgi:hypothetical protein